MTGRDCMLLARSVIHLEVVPFVIAVRVKHARGRNGYSTRVINPLYLINQISFNLAATALLISFISSGSATSCRFPGLFP